MLMVMIIVGLLMVVPLVQFIWAEMILTQISSFTSNIVVTFESYRCSRIIRNLLGHRCGVKSTILNIGIYIFKVNFVLRKEICVSVGTINLNGDITVANKSTNINGISRPNPVVNSGKMNLTGSNISGGLVIDGQNHREAITALE